MKTRGDFMTPWGILGSMAKFDNLYRPLPDSYELPPLPPEPPAPPRRSWTSTVLAFVCLGGVFSGLLFVVPKFREAFSEIRMSVPASTAFVFNFSRIVRDWPIPFLMVALGFAGWAGRPGLTSPGRRLRDLIDLGCFVFAIWSLWAIFTPLLAPLGSMGPLGR